MTIYKYCMHELLLRNWVYVIDCAVARLGRIGLVDPVSFYIYISGVRSLGHRVKPNMAANGGPNLRQSQSPYAVFHIYVYSKNCAGGLKPT